MKVFLHSMKRKMMSVILTAAMLFGTAVPVAAESPGGYTDIPGNWSKAAVEAAVSNGLLTGFDNKIMPDADLRRCEMAAIINRAFGAAQKGDISKFTDISAGRWYAEEMAKAVKMGTFTGNGDKMRPEDPITRQEAFVVLARAFKLTTSDYASLDQFSDKAQAGSWAKPELAALVAAGYVSGNAGRLDPLSNISRAEFSQVMYNVLKTYIKAAGTYTTVADGNVMINVPDVTLKGVTVKGDLIIGDGVGTGNVTLDAVKVEGRTVVRGGGKNSVHVINGSTITGTVIIDNVNNEVRIVTDQGTTIEKIEAGSQVILEGSFGEVTVTGDGSNTAGVEVRGNIQTLTVEAKADVTLTNGTVTNVNISQTAGGTTVNAAQGARIETVTANAKANITGSGTVSNVEAKANDVKIDTAGTKVTAAQGVTGVTAGGQAVAGGSSATSGAAAPSGGGGTGGPGHTSSSDATLSNLTVSDGANCELYPAFSSGVTTYYAAVASGTTSVAITAAVHDSAAGVSYRANSATVTNPVALASDPYAVGVVVTAEDGTTKTYTVHINQSMSVTAGQSIAHAGVYGPASGAVTVNGDVTINAAGAALRNLIITGDLTFGADIGSGDAYINNVTVQGKTIVNGGGSNSIHIQGASDLGVVEVDDQRSDQTEPINISAEGTGTVAAISIATAAAVKVTPITNTIGYVVAADGIPVTYGDTANKTALLNKIIAKSDAILDAAIIGATDDDKQLADLVSLTAGVVDTSQYGIGSLKYYINPLDGVSGYQEEFDRMQTKLIAKLWDSNFIQLRNSPSSFNEHLIDDLLPGGHGPELGPSQGWINEKWDAYSRYLAYKKYEVSGSGTVAASSGNTDDSTTRSDVISTAETLYSNFTQAQMYSVVADTVAIDMDDDGLTAGDSIEITFQRRLIPGDSAAGQDAISSLITSNVSEFGSGASVAWDDTATISFYGAEFEVSKCTITLGTGSDPGLLGGSFIIPKDKLGSYIPDDFVEIGGQYGGYITDLQPLFDITVEMPSEAIVPHVPALDGNLTRATQRSENSNLGKYDFARGDSVEIGFNCKLAQSSVNSIINWVTENDDFGTGTEQGGKCAFVVGDPDVTKLLIQFGSDPLIRLSGTFTIPRDFIYDPTGLKPASDITVDMPDSF